MSDNPTPCPRCHGDGCIIWYVGPARLSEVCPDCDGEGVIENRDGEMEKTGDTDAD